MKIATKVFSKLVTNTIVTLYQPLHAKTSRSFVAPGLVGGKKQGEDVDYFLYLAVHVDAR